MRRLGGFTEGRHPTPSGATCIGPVGDAAKGLWIVSAQVRLTNDGCVGSICFLDKPTGGTCSDKGGSRDGNDGKCLDS